MLGIPAYQSFFYKSSLSLSSSKVEKHILFRHKISWYFFHIYLYYILICFLVPFQKNVRQTCISRKIAMEQISGSFVIINKLSYFLWDIRVQRVKYIHSYEILSTGCGKCDTTEQLEHNGFFFQIKITILIYIM